MRKVLVIGFTFLVSLNSSVLQAVEYIPAKLLDSPRPKHPNDVSKKDLLGSYQSQEANSGMVELAFIVDEAGLPTKIEVVRSSSDYLELQGVKAVEKYKYQPATLDSKPVSSRNIARVEFDRARVAKFKPVREPSKYKRLYKNLIDELKKETPSERRAANILRKIRGSKYKTFLTSMHTELAQYKFFAKFGTKPQQLESLLTLMMFEDVKWSGRQVLGAETKLIVQVGILKLMFDLGHNAEALDRFGEYSKNNPKIVDIFLEYIDKLRGIQHSDAVIERKLTISSRGYTSLLLFKRSFFIDPLLAQIDTFELKCDTKYAQFNFRQLAEYRLPTDWGRCELQINGKPGSTISIVQQ